MSKKYGELIRYDILFEGILKKSPPQKSKAFFNFITKFSCTGDYNKSSAVDEKRWRKRHFVLYKTARPYQIHFLYFKAEPTAECKNIGTINLVKLTNLSVDVGSIVNRSNVFSIQTFDEKGDNRIYYLCAQSLELMNLWVDKIVTSLNLNNQNYRFESVANLYSPISQTLLKGNSRITSNSISTPKLNLTPWSNHTSPEPSRFSFNSINERSNENMSSYYNLSPLKSPLFQENLEDPISTEEEDIYKYPCENPNAHAYVNLKDEEVTPIIVKLSSPGNLFFPNDDKLFNNTNEIKSVVIPSCQEYKFPVDHLDFEYNNLSVLQNDTKLPIFDPEKNLSDEDTCDFNFPLPTRIKRDSTSSSSSSSSSSEDDIGKNHKYFEADVECSVKPNIDPSPPRVPKRLNLPDTNISLLHKNNISTETVLPIKTPKIFTPKTDSSDMCTSLNEESFTALNYLDAESLFYNNRKLNNCRDSTFTSFDIDPSNSSDQISSSDFNLGRDSPFHLVLEDSAMLPSSTVVKEFQPSVEYREICDARTEALLKLNVRILNNE